MPSFLFNFKLANFNTENSSLFWRMAVLALAVSTAFVFDKSQTCAAAYDNKINFSELFHDQGPLFCDVLEPGSRQNVTVKFRCLHDDVSEVVLNLFENGKSGRQLIPMSREADNGSAYDYWKAVIPASAARKHYRFELKDGTATAWYNANGASSTEPEHGDFFVLPDFHTPQWLKDGVIYQIFPDRFFDGNKANNIKSKQYFYAGSPTIQRNWGESPIPKKGENVVMTFYGGDLDGVLQKLPYLRKTLGANIIYLNPIFSSPSNHKYDTCDYEHVASCLGSDDTLVKLSSELHKSDAGRRAYLLLDGVFNHTGDGHRWFGKYQYEKASAIAGAYQSKKSPYSSFYTFTHWPDKYATFLNVDSLPKLNYGSQKLKDAIYAKPNSIAVKYLKAPFFIDGWRVDAPQYEDENGKQGTDKFNHMIWREFRQAVKSVNPQATVLGEYWQDASDWLKEGDQWDSVTNFDGFTQPVSRWIAGRNFDDRPDKISASEFDLGLRLTRAHYPSNVQQCLSNHLSNHDICRFAQRAGGDLRKVKLALIFQMTYLGVPTIYYGDEYGMEGGKDPDDRRTFDWAQVESKNSAISLAHDLIALRNKYSALRSGSFVSLNVEDASNTYVFGRWDKSSKIAVALNADNHPHEVEISLRKLEVPDGTKVTDAVSGNNYTVKGGSISVNLDAYAGSALVCDSISK